MARYSGFSKYDRQPAARPLMSNEELFRIGMELRQRDAQRAQAMRRADWQAKLEEDERKAMSKSIRIGNRDYTWNDLRNESVRRELLPEIEKMIASYKADPKPWQAAGWTDQDLRFAIRFTTGQFDGYTEEQMGKTVLGSAYQPASTQLSGRELAREVGKLQGDTTYRIAKERKAAGRELSPAQNAALQKMAELEALTDAEARREKPPLPGRYPTEQSFVSTRIQEIAKLPPFEQVNAAREYRAELKRHPVYLDERHPEHKHILEEHHMTYASEEYEGGGAVMPEDSK